jgi:hypothetical protein
MSLSQETLLELMALADGELDGEAKTRAERLAGESREARSFVDAMRAPISRVWLGEEIAEERARGSGGIADAVMGRIALDSAAREPGQRREIPSGPAHRPEAELGVVRRIAAPATRSPRAPKRAAVWASSGLALAMAAGVTLYFGSAARSLHVAPVASVAPPAIESGGLATTESALARHTATPPAHGVVVDEIDSPSRDVSIFQIPTMANASAASSVVVWIDDDPGAR